MGGAPYEKGATPLNSFAFEQITVDNTAGGKAFTSETYRNGTQPAAIAAFCTVETAAIRYTVDGTTVTASVGHAVEPGSTFVVWGSKDIQAFRAIRRDGTSATLSVTYAGVN